MTLSNSAIVIRQKSLYGQCNQLEEGCQIKLALETLAEAVRKVSSLSDYNFGDKMQKGQIKNRLLAEIRLLLGNQETFAQYCGNCDRYVLQTFERNKDYDHRRDGNDLQSNNGNIKLQTNGEWTPFKGLLQDEEKVLVSKSGLSGRKIQVGIINQHPYVNIEMVNGNCVINGTTFELFKMLSDRMNFTIDWICYPEIDEIGQKQSDDRFNGILAKLAAGDVDLIANGAWKTPSRINTDYFEFLFPHDVEMVDILVKKTPEDDAYLFLAPFTVDVSLIFQLRTILESFIKMLIAKLFVCIMRRNA